MTNPNAILSKFGETLTRLQNFCRKEPWLTEIREPTRWKFCHEDSSQQWTDGEGFFNKQGERIVTQVVREGDGTARLSVFSPLHGHQCIQFDSFQSLVAVAGVINQAITTNDK